MTENSLSADTVRAILRFRDDRNWAPFHHPKDLALSISIEAAELLECFQWSGTDADVSEKRARQAEELADVLIYGVLLADRLGVDLNAAVRAKLSKNAERYPADTCRKGASDAERLEAYARLKDEARSEGREETPEEKALERFRSAAAAYAKHLASVRHRPGTWASDDENRIVFTRYTQETTDFWRELDTLRASEAGDLLLKGSIYGTTVRIDDVSTEKLRHLLPADAFAVLVTLLREERIEDGAWQRWAAGRRLEALLSVFAMNDEDDSNGDSEAHACTPAATHSGFAQPFGSGSSVLCNLASNSVSASASGASPAVSESRVSSTVTSRSFGPFADLIGLLSFLERAEANPTILGRTAMTPMGPAFTYGPEAAKARRLLSGYSDGNYVAVLESRGITSWHDADPDRADGRLIGALITDILRSERDRPAVFVEAVEKGFLTRLVKRVAKLLESPPRS
ncbi:MazG-like family protein [Sutterella megalosphaeroides]|uniref:Nucleotide pyrophosphohydrolase n=1 Tax=Sutterella megalosphaeroides TaxID=2494234 RepID=A0A2Z6IA64_9BURK|nr:hypothetical protein SUTMEG_12660 [Sutterella megalosphaeroides]